MLRLCKMSQFDGLPAEIKAVILVSLMLPNKSEKEQCYNLLQVLNRLKSINHEYATYVDSDDVLYEYACRTLNWDKPYNKTWQEHFIDVCMAQQSPQKEQNEENNPEPPNNRKKGPTTHATFHGTPRTLTF